MNKRKIYVGDFETTVYDGQTETEVWASASVELYSEDVFVTNSIDKQFKYFTNLGCNVLCYYHNLKFDGNFWVYYLSKVLKFKQAFVNNKPLSFVDMPNNSFNYLITSLGHWYYIRIKCGENIIEFRDSLKLLPFSVKYIGETFGTKHKKLDIEYKGVRCANAKITEQEKEYIKNDVLVVKEALEIMYQQNHTKITIGACCLAEYKKIIGYNNYQELFPDLTLYSLNYNLYNANNVDEYIRKAYHGGWCYLAKGKENKIYHNGTTCDVNSLYPSMMSSESGNVYPYGAPIFWKGNYIPPICNNSNIYYYLRVKCKFYLKKDKLPFVQLKNNMLYKSTEMLETSDIYNYKDGLYYDKYVKNGTIYDTHVILTLTMTDYKLFLEHYDVIDFEILDGCYFYAKIGLFDEYINKYKKIKMNSKGALRQLAKLFLNNLYGKLASSKNSSYKIIYFENDDMKMKTINANDKTPGYIAVGAAITSYSRAFTITAAQKNYYGKDKRGFIYADTDSIHCDLLPSEIKGAPEDDVKFCCWKYESNWDKAIYVRSKTYIEHITAENKAQVQNPYYNIKCAGMSEKCKQLLTMSFEGCNDLNNLTSDEIQFVKTKRDLTDFKVGLTVPGKLLPKKIKGGVLLVDTTYKIR